MPFARKPTQPSTAATFALFTSYVAWPNGWLGDHVHGHQAVREYRTRQWAEVNPTVEPVPITDTADGRAEVGCIRW